MTRPSTYAEARATIFKIGAMTENHETHLMLDEVLASISHWEQSAIATADHLVNMERTIHEKQRRIDALEEEVLEGADTFDSVLAHAIMESFADQGQRLDTLAGALARLGAVVEGGDS